MQLFKNVISLNQAAKISGYTQDYLGSLIRSGEIKGVKKGGVWFTTEGEITHYISKQKAIHRKLAVKDFLQKVTSKKLAVRDFVSHLSPRNFLVSSIVLFVAFSSTGFYFFKKYDSSLVPTFRAPSFVLASTAFTSKAKNISLPTFPTLPNFPNPFPILKKIGKVYVDGIASAREAVESSSRDFTIAKINSAKEKINSVKEFSSSLLAFTKEKISSNEKFIADSKIKVTTPTTSLARRKVLSGTIRSNKKVSSVAIAKNKINVGSSLTDISDGVSYGWGAFIGTIIDNAKSSADNTKKLASSLSSLTNSLSKASQIKIATPSANLASVASAPSPKPVLHLPAISLSKVSELTKHSLNSSAIAFSQTTASVGSSLTNVSGGVSYGWESFIGGIINNAKGTANGFALGMDSFVDKIRSSARSFLGITDVNPKIYIQEIPVIVKVPETPPASQPTTIIKNIYTSPAGSVSPSSRITINQYDPSILPRIQGIELAILNNISHNSVQTIRIYDSAGSNLASAIHNLTQSGTFNSPTLKDSTFANFTSTGRSDFTRAPTLAHSFTTWPDGTSNAANATLYINPAASVGNGNLIGASVADVVKFIVDAEGSIYGNSMILTGSVTSGATTVASLSVLDNAIIGDAGTDTLTVNANTMNLAGSAPIFDTTDVTATLGINTTTNRPVTFGTGIITIPNISATTITSSGNTTLATGINTTNTFGSGASSINTIGSATTPGALTLHGATTLDHTFSQTGANTFSTGTGIVSLNGDTTIATGKTFTVTNGTTGILGATSINTSGSNATDIGTGTNAGTITIGNITTGDLALNDANWNVTGLGAANFTSIGVATQGSGAFTTLTSSGASTIATGASLTNTFGAGTGAINTFGNATGTNAVNGTTNITGATTILGTTLINTTNTLATTIGNATGLLTLHGATSLDNTFSQTGANTFGTGTGAISLNGATTVTGTNTFATGSGTSTFGGDILASTGNINIGSTGTHFGTVYADNVTATNIYGTIVTGSTSANDWIINSDNATADTENMSLAFERGSLTPNATLVWDATGKKFILNAPLELASTIGTATFLSPGLITATSGLTATTGNITATAGNVAITAGLLSLNGVTRIDNTGVGTFITGTVIGSQTFTTNNIADSGALTIASGTASALTLNSGTTGDINIGTDASAETINIGNTGVAGKIINIGNNATAGTVTTIGSATNTDLALLDPNWSVTGAGAGTFTSISSGAGAISGGAGSFTTLTSSGASTIATGATLTNTFGTGTAANNTFGEATGTNAVNGTTNITGSTTILGTTLINTTNTLATTIGNSTGVLTLASGGTSGWTNTSGNLTIQTATSGTMAIDSAGILNLGTVNSTATNLGKSATTLTINPTAWTATPTISGLITATSGITSNGAVTVQNNSNLIIASGTGTFAQTYTGTTTTASTITADSLTTGIGQLITSTGLTSGSLLSLTSAGTAGLTGQKGLNIALSGTNATAAQTTYGAYISNTHAGTTSTNVGLYATATGGTTANYAAIFESGNVGIGTTAPGQKLSVLGAGIFGSTNAWVSGGVSAGTDLAIQGSVGIGTTSPGNRLELYGSGHEKLLITSTGTNNAVGFQITQASGGGAAEQIWQLQTIAGSHALTWRDATDNRNDMTFDGNGNVGIGTTTPTAKLGVSLGSSYSSGNAISLVGKDNSLSQNDYLNLALNTNNAWVLNTGASSTATASKGSDVAPHDLTSDTSHFPYVITSSVENSGMESWRAFNNSNSDRWNPLLSTGWVKIDLGLGNAKMLYSYALSSFSDAARTPKNWTLSGSNDDSTYTVISTVTNQTTWSAYETKEFVNDDISTTYRYFKLTVTAINGGVYLDINEIYLYQNGVTTAPSFMVTTDNGSTYSTFKNSNLGIGTTSPTNILSLGNTQAQKFWIEPTANTIVGRALTIEAGSTLTAGTADMAGGNLILSSGAGKGTGASTISFLTGTTLTTGNTLQTLSEKMTILGSGFVGIGDTTPASLFTVGSGDLFQVDSTGNIVKLNNVTTSFPASQGATGSLLTNSDGAGTLTWGSPSGTGILGYWTRTGTNLYNTNQGDNVGIGTTGPVAKLTVGGATGGLTSGWGSDVINLNVSPSVNSSNGTIVAEGFGNGSILPRSGLLVLRGGRDVVGSYTVAASNADYLGAITFEGISSTTGVSRLSSYITSRVSSVQATTLSSSLELHVTNSSGTDVDALHILSSGNVGIGTTNPGYKLEVQGSLGITDHGISSNATYDALLSHSVSSPYSILNVDSKGGADGWYGAIDFRTSYNGGALSPVMRITTGNVGIGTTEPGAGTAGKILELWGNSAATVPQMVVTNDWNANSNGIFQARKSRNGGVVTTGDWLGQLEFRGHDGTGFVTGAYIAGVTEGTIATNQMPTSLQFYTENLTGTTAERMRISPNGNVGIGTTNPTQKLQIGDGTGIQVVSATGGTGAGQGSAFYIPGILALGNEAVITGVGTSQTPSLYTYSSLPLNLGVNSIPAVTIINGGNVGIGTTNPGAKLEVSQDSQVGKGAYFRTGSSSTSLTLSGANQRGYGIIGYAGSPADTMTSTYGGDYRKTGGAFFASDIGANGYITTGVYSEAQSNGSSESVAFKGMASGATNNYGVYVTADKNYFSGNVGIGTTAPESALKVAGTTGLTWASGVGGTASFGLATFGNGGTGGSLWVNTPSLNTTFNSGLGITGSYGTPASRSVVNINAYGVLSGGGYGSDLAFSTTLGPALNERMRIDMNGNVGIGTTAVSSAYLFTRTLSIENPTNAELQLKGSTGILSVGSTAAYNYFQSNVGYDFQTGGTSKVTILSGGNVGIGTATPGSLLHIKAATPYMQIESSEGNNSGIKFTASTVTKNAIILQNIGNYYRANMHFVLNGVADTSDYTLGTDTRMMIRYDGNVGIGTTNPGAKLDIVDSDATGAAIRLREGATNGVEYIGLKAPNAITTSQTYILPATVGTVNQVLSLVTVATGELGWAANSSSGMSNPLTTTGDTIYASNTAAPATAARLAIGTAGQCLIVSAGLLPSWGACSGAAGVAGATTQVQYNLGGVLSATANFTWDNTNFTLSSLGSVDGNKTSLALRNTSTGNTAVDSLHIGNDTAVDTFDLWTNSSTNTTGANAAFIYNRQNAPLVFGTNNAEAMRILSGGNVGIGTTAPGVRLEIGGTASSNLAGPHLWFRSAQDVYPEMTMYNYAHNNVALTFDSYVDPVTGSEKSSSSNSSFDIYKQATIFSLRYGVATAGNDVTMNNGIVLNSAGNVGIGTTAPSTRLDIEAAIGNLNIVSTTGTNPTYLRLQNGGGTSYIGLENSTGTSFGGAAYGLINFVSGNYPIHFFTNSYQRMIINNNGNVGIGTTAPSQLLNVYGASATSLVQSSSGNATYALRPASATSGRLDFQNSAGTVKAIIASVDASDGLQFYTNGTTEQMRILSTGNVGIGTTAPDATLQLGANTRLRSNTWADPITPNATAFSSGERINFYKDATYNTAIGMLVGNGIWMQAHGTATNPLLQLWSGAVGGAPTAKMTVTMDGNVGIGTTNPTQTLELLSSTTNIGLKVYNSSALGIASGGIGLFGTSLMPTAAEQRLGVIAFQGTNNVGGTNTIAAIVGLSAGDWTGGTVSGLLSFKTNNGEAVTEKMRIDSNGNVGIGTTAPEDKLHIAGGNLILGPVSTSAGATGALQFRELAVNGTEFVGFKAPDAITTSVTYTLPSTDGTINQVLQTNGSGTLSWTANSAASGMSNPLTTTGDMVYASNTATPATAARLQIGTNGQCLVVTGGLPAWGACPTAAGLVPAGNTTEVQFNNAGAFGTSSSFLYDSSTLTLSSLGTVAGDKVSLALRNASTGNTATNSLHIGNDTAVDTLDLWVNSNANTNGANNAYIYNRQAAPLIFGTSNAEKMRILANGNVGIGTTAPGVKLSLDDNTKATTDQLTLFGYSATTKLHIGEFDDSSYIFNNYYYNGGQLTDDAAISSSGLVIGPDGIAFQHAPASATPARVTDMFIKNNGNVGIGTTGPAFPLSFSSSVGGKINLYTDSTTLVAGFGVQSNLLEVIGQNSSMDYTFGYGTSGALTRIMTIKGTGNVGIGTTNPGAKLDVKNDDGITNGLHIIADFNRNAGTDAQLILGYYADGASVTTPVVYSGNSMPLAFSTGATERMRITSTGNVGIGTTAPGTIVNNNSSYLLGNIDSGDKFLDVAGADGTPPVINLVNSLDTDGGTIGGLMFSRSGGATDAHRNLAGIIGVQHSWAGGSATTRGADLAFWTNTSGAAAEVMRILGNGNVGIGTTAPATGLHVKGAGAVGVITVERTGLNGAGAAGVMNLLTDAKTANDGIILSMGALDSANNAQTYSYLETKIINPTAGIEASEMQFYTMKSGVMTPQMVIQTSGNVGIGTTAPATTLDVNGTVRAIGALTPTSGSGVEMIFTGDQGYLYAYNRTTPGYKNLILGTAANQLFLKNDGNVGIGTAGPTAKLAVAATGGLPAISGATSNAAVRIQHLDAQGITNVIDMGNQAASPYGSWIQSVDSGDLATNYNLLLNPNGGNVGIGTTTPDAKLSVYGGNIAIKATSGLVPNGTMGYLGFGAAGYDGVFPARITANFQGTSWFSGSNLTFSTHPGGDIMTGAPTERMRIDKDGSIRFNAYGAGTLSTDASGNITSSSDERLKNIQGNFTTGLQAVLALNPILYKWNATSGMEMQTTYAGFSAQNVQSVIPEAVDMDPRGYLSLQDRPIMAATVNAIKELNLKVEDNATKIAQLETRINDADITLKKNIVNIKDDMEFALQTVPTDMASKSTFDKLMTLTPVKYNWKTEADGATKHVGFIAQEVEQIFPDLVFTDPVTGLKSVAFTNLIPYTIEAIQEMNLKLGQIGDMSKPNIFRSAISSWLENSSNKITRIFTGEVCLTDADGQTECINRSELKQLKGLMTASPVIIVPTCTATQSLVNNVCVENTPAVVVPTCTATQTLVNNVCTDGVVVPTCTATQTLVNNVCTDPVVADLTAYNTALGAKIEADYTPESWITYKAILDANIVTTANTQAQVDTATTNITTAQANLAPKI